MKEIQLWALDTDDSRRPRVVPVDALHDTDTEHMLEEILVSSPDLLMSRLRLVGRQIPTQGGPLDLLGVDETGRLVLFELKRGTLTREAVAQAIDYASDLYYMDLDDLQRHLAERSGHHGIDRIEDFRDWYDQTYPGSGEALRERPRIVLVGLGADDRTIRMVNFLADSAIDIQVLTFHAFRRDGQLFLAKQVETMAPTTRESVPASTGYSKASNTAFVTAKAQELHVAELLEAVRAFLHDRLPAYEWPGKYVCSFSLLERTESGRPSYRVHVSIGMAEGKPHRLNLIITQNAFDAAPEAVTAFQTANSGIAKMHDKYRQVDVLVTEANWPTVRDALESLLPEIVAGWKRNQSEGENEADG